MHIFTDEGLVSEQLQTSEGQIEYTLIAMKRRMLFEQCQAEVKEISLSANPKVDSSRCPTCHSLFFYEADTSTNTCRQCGLSVFVIEHATQSWHERGNYNTNPKHYYAKKEHFQQTLLDMTCTGNRRVPVSVVTFCKAMLGRGDHITYKQVFVALQAGGYSRFYNSRYEVAARLRGRPEIILSPREIDKVRGNYHRYDVCFYDFQVEHSIGNRSRSRRLRLYWPVRFIMVEMFKLIDRHDLIKHVKGVAGRKRLKLYKQYWEKLRIMVDRRRPQQLREHTLTLTRLPRPQPRMTLQEYRALRQLECLSSSCL